MAATKKCVFFFGGGWDAKSQIVKSAVQSYKNAKTFPRADVVEYFSHTEKTKAIRLIKDQLLPLTNYSLVLVGHSYGGDTAYLVARDSGARVKLLVTVDPVSRWTFGISKPSATKRWVNLWVDGIQTKDDLIAIAGGHWGKMDAADVNHKFTNLGHGNFNRMMQGASPSAFAEINRALGS